MAPAETALIVGVGIGLSAALARRCAGAGMLLPEALAETMLHVHRQHRSAWSLEIAQRPWVETF